jgi:hypothetical protein
LLASLSYVILESPSCDIVLNVHAPKEDKIDYVKDRFYEKLERAFSEFPKYRKKILVGDFSARVGEQDIF